MLFFKEVAKVVWGWKYYKIEENEAQLKFAIPYKRACIKKSTFLRQNHQKWAKSPKKGPRPDFSQYFDLTPRKNNNKKN